MNDPNIVQGVYDPAEQSPRVRWVGLARLLESCGRADESWFLTKMRQLAVSRRGDRKLEAEILEAIGKHEQLAVLQNLHCVFPKPNLSPIGDGILLGHMVDVSNGSITPTQEPVRLPLKAFLEHAGIFSKTGGGKTLLLTQILMSSAPECGQFIFEVRKHDLRGLHALFLKQGIHLGVLNWRDHTLRFNPLEVPPGAHPQTWITELSEMFQSAFDLPEGAERLLQCAIHQQYKENGILDGGDNYGDVFELKRRIEEMKEYAKASREALLNRLDLLVRKLGPRTLAYVKGYPIHEMESGHWLFMLDGLPTPVSAFISNFFIAFVLRRRLEDPRRNKPLLFALEEAKDLLTKPNPEFNKNLEIVRSSGLSLLFNTQVSSLNEGVRNACSLKIMGKLDEPEVRDLAPSFRLEPRQKDWWMDNQQTRLFLLKCDLLSYRKAFLFWSAKVDLPTNADPDAFAATQELTVGRLAEHLVPSRYANEPAQTNHSPDHDGAARVDIAPTLLPDIDIAHVAYLTTIVSRPDLPSTQYDGVVEIDGKVGIGRAKGARIRQGLIDAGLVRPVKIMTGGHKDYNILRPTVAAWAHLPGDLKEKYLAEYPDPASDRPGPAHDHKMRRILTAFTAGGYRADTEHPVELAMGGTFQLDLNLESPDGTRRIGIEIQETDLDKVREKTLLLQSAERLTEGYVIVPSRRGLVRPEGTHAGKVRIETLATFLDTVRP